ncbi:MAG: BrnT family toxin [Pyrinomonadaceae bacterium]|nr:BrnT family toxin [Pyrinomonadaceae bacterium]
MKIKGMIWLEEIVYKLERKHSVKTSEVIELFNSTPRFRFIEKGHRKDENVYAALGKTDSGRFLICFFVYKRDHRALVLSARDMTPGERRKYDKK